MNEFKIISKNSNNELYLSDCDSNGIPLLKRIEKYPNLSEDVFVSIEYPEIKEGTYKINKKGEIQKNGIILKGTRSSDNYIQYSLLDINSKSRSFRSHRLVAFTFLVNPDIEIYTYVNHIDHNTKNNKLDNLEWVTPSRNNSSKVRSEMSEDKYVNYIALDELSNEVFVINSKSTSEYSLSSIYRSIINNKKYKGYYWKRDKERIIPGFSGNLDDYEWILHNNQKKYPGFFLCKEGFIKYKDGIHKERVLSNINSDGYIKVNVRNDLGILKPYLVHRVIMEHLLNRELDDKEIVDHINTIKTDNSFNNLRLTDLKGNMNNLLTLRKHYKKIILTDLFGNIIDYNYIDIIYKNIYGEEIGSNKPTKSQLQTFRKRNFIKNKYFCINPETIKDVLYDKMNSIIYRFNKDKSIVNAYSLIKLAEEDTIISSRTISSYINLEKLAPDGYYYMKGEKAIDMILTLGYGNVLKFNKENYENIQ